MKTIASTSSLLLVCVGCGVLSLGFGSCSSASSSSGGMEKAGDSGVADTGSARDVATDVVAAADTGAALDAGARDTGAPESGGEDAGLCGAPDTMLGATCDGCIATNCEPSWCACAAGPSDGEDAGDAGSGCLQYVECVQTCVGGEAGSPTDCLTKVCAVPPFTTPQEQAGHAFLDCLVQYCGTECGQ